MTTTIATEPLTSGNLTLTDIAARVDQAANLIERDGLEHGDMWSTGLLMDYADGIACCTGGALAVACGYRNAVDVEALFFGIYPVYGVTTVAPGPHPVLAAVMAEMCCTEVEQLFDWSDSARADQVVARLRSIAATFRIRGAA